MPDESATWQVSQSAHPVALLFFLVFKAAALLTYLFGLLFTNNFVLIFVIVILLLAADFWTTKNVSGRLLVGLRWWNETNSNGESIWVFESADPTRLINATDSRFFWWGMYLLPVLWVAFGIISIIKLHFIWLTLVVIAITLNIANTLAFSRCDKFSRANSMLDQGMGSSLTGSIGRRLLSRFWR